MQNQAKPGESEMRQIEKHGGWQGDLHYTNRMKSCLRVRPYVRRTEHQQTRQEHQEQQRRFRPAAMSVTHTTTTQSKKRQWRRAIVKGMRWGM